MASSDSDEEWGVKFPLNQSARLSERHREVSDDSSAVQPLVEGDEFEDQDLEGAWSL